MADLKSLDGISDARNELYNQLEKGKISEARAIAQNRILEGQTTLKALIPIRMATLVMRAKNPVANKYAEPLMKRILGFVGGPDAIEEADAAPTAPAIEGPTT